MLTNRMPLRFYESLLVAAVALLAPSLASLTAATPTPTILLDSQQPGPTVLALNGSAADDVSGAIALRQVATWTLSRGRILTANIEDEAAANRIIQAVAPAAVVILRVEKGGSATASLAPSLAVRGLDSESLRSQLNGLLDSGTAPLEAAAAATLARQNTLPSVAVELAFTARRGAPSPGERTRLFRHATHAVLVSAGLTTSDPWRLINPAGSRIKVAIYAGGGSSTTPGLAAYPACLDRAAQTIDYTYVGPIELARPHALDPFDVVVFCGGSGSGQAKSLGEAGAANVKAFVERGGGYVSSCAGSYLATSGYSWSLGLVAADTVDSAHWARGTGPVDIELTAEGKTILGDYQGLQSVRYANGPLLGPAKNPRGVAPYTVLAHFRSDMAKKVPGGVMPNTPAMIAGTFGQGRVLCFSPHPEYTESLQGMIARAVTWAAQRPLAP